MCITFNSLTDSHQMLLFTGQYLHRGIFQFPNGFSLKDDQKLHVNVMRLFFQFPNGFSLEQVDVEMYYLLKYNFQFPNGFSLGV